MLSIGEFSKICGVSTKTLRYYDEIGLIHPDDINPENGYRHYAIGQLAKMLLINRLKSYHFSLEEIKTVLAWEGDESQEKLHAALSRKKTEIEEKLNAFRSTLTQLSGDLLMLERGLPVMSYLSGIEVQLVDVELMNILYLRQLVGSEDYAAGYGAYFGRLYERIAVDGLTLLGTPMTVYHSPDYNPAGNDTEFALPVKEAVKGTRELAAGLCARSVFKGPYSALTSVYARLREWVEQEGYELTDSPFEIYVTDPACAAAREELVTEVYFPVKKKIAR